MRLELEESQQLRGDHGSLAVREDHDRVESALVGRVAVCTPTGPHIIPVNYAVVDDSIVRGNTTRKIVQMLFEAGAAEVHLRISSPPVIGQCFYGMDFAEEDELIASSRSVDEVREHVGATSLAYISLEGLQDSTRRPASELCRACLTRDYPTEVPRESAKLRFEPAVRA